MKVDIDGLNDEVKPQLEKAIKKLDEAKSKLTGIDIPDDFYFSSKLSNMPQDIFNINENIKNFEKWLDGKISSLGNAESSNKSLIDNIFSWLSNLFFDDNTTSDTAEILRILEESGVDIENMTTNEFFAYFSSSDYGVDQGVLREYFYYEEDENGNLILDEKGKPILVKKENYPRIEKLVMDKYNMSAKDAAVLITCLDSIGACSYAATVGNIIAEFKDSPEEFEEIFGFSMYRKTEDGKVVLNQEELLIDLYVYANSQGEKKQKRWKTEDGYIDSTFDKYEGKLVVDTEMLGKDEKGSPQFKNQQYLYETSGPTKIGESYLNSKTISYKYDNNTIVTLAETAYGIDRNDIEKIKKDVNKRINNGEEVTLTMWPGFTNGQWQSDSQNIDPIYFDYYIGEYAWTCELDGNHTVKVTNATDEGLLFSTWGYEAFISYDELERRGAFDLYSTDISKNSIGKLGDFVEDTVEDIKEVFNNED